MNRELTKLESRFSGIVSLEELPAAVFILDTKKENNAVVEANSIGIPVIGLSNANADIGVDTVSYYCKYTVTGGGDVYSWFG